MSQALPSVTGNHHPDGPGIWRNLPRCNCGREMRPVKAINKRPSLIGSRLSVTVFACPQHQSFSGHDLWAPRLGWKRRRKAGR